jgi:sulfur relay (sulfurtransferase) complex TusBCD TusD component (DsrE family)
MAVERQMSVSVSVVIIISVSWYKFSDKNSSVRFACKAVHQVGCPVAVQLFEFSVTNIKKVCADDLDLHTNLKTLNSVL